MREHRKNVLILMFSFFFSIKPNFKTNNMKSDGIQWCKRLNGKHYVFFLPFFPSGWTTTTTKVTYFLIAWREEAKRVLSWSIHRHYDKPRATSYTLMHNIQVHSSSLKSCKCVFNVFSNIISTTQLMVFILFGCCSNYLSCVFAISWI